MTRESACRIDQGIGLVSKMAARGQVREDFGADQLHHLALVSLLVLFASVTGVVEYAGQPLDCWASGASPWKHFQVW